jgi:HPt (histidine-containing phosphotransfer) domain-containing protein
MSDPQQRWDFLHARYAQSFASKHAMLAQAWRAFTDAADEANIDELHQLVHRLAGSAPTYGYELLGRFAHAVDNQLAEWADLPFAARGGSAALAQRLTAPMQALLDCLARHAADPSAQLH